MNSEPKVILVTTSIGKDEALELILKAIKAYSNRNYRVIVKLHPAGPQLDLHLPDNFTISNTPVSQLLEEASLLLYTSSTTCVEAVGVGIPALQVQSDYRIDMDILAMYPGARETARTPAEILSKTQLILKDSGLILTDGHYLYHPTAVMNEYPPKPKVNKINIMISLVKRYWWPFLQLALLPVSLLILMPTGLYALVVWLIEKWKK